MTADVGDGDDGSPELNRGIVLSVLHRMAGLMTGNTDCSGGSAVIHTIR